MSSQISALSCSSSPVSRRILTITSSKTALIAARDVSCRATNLARWQDAGHRLLPGLFIPPFFLFSAKSAASLRTSSRLRSVKLRERDHVPRRQGFMAQHRAGFRALLMGVHSTLFGPVKVLVSAPALAAG